MAARRERFLQSRLRRLLVFAALFFVLGGALYARTIQVCQTCDIRSIQKAVDKAQNGDQVFVAEGRYPEQITIAKSIRLTGKNYPHIDGKSVGNTVSIRAKRVIVENFLITSSGVSDRYEYAGVHVSDSGDCQILRNRILDNTYGVYIANVRNCHIGGNTITGNTINEVLGGNGVHMWKTEGVHVSGNTISHHRDGIYIEFSKKMKIEDNHASHNLRYGMHFMYADRGEFRRNTFTRNETGVAIMYSKSIVVEQNVFEYSWGLSAYGLLLKDIADSDFRRNRFFNNTVAVFADNSNRNRFAENELEKNGFALQVFGNCEENKFIRNTFRANFFDVGYNAKETSNDFSGNYWDQYAGYDLNRDGFGDIPFKPVRVFSYWLTKYNPLAVLLLSPALEFLETAERAFPVITPVNLVDSKPLMRPITGRKN